MKYGNMGTSIIFNNNIMKQLLDCNIDFCTQKNRCFVFFFFRGVDDVS